MPRGKKKSALQNIEDQVTKMDQNIEKYQEKINDLQTKKKGLLEAMKKAELEILYSKIQASGKSINEILKSLDS